MLPNLIIHIVDLSRRFAWAIALCALAAALALGWFAVTHFKINTDINQLLAADLPWRQREMALEKAFPQKVDIIVVVLDGDTPDAAEDGAAALAGKLRAMPDMFTYVDRPDAIPFFRKNGLLFLPANQLSDILNQLVQAQPLLGTLASDPSLRGLFDTLGMMLQGLARGSVDYAQLERPFTQITATIGNAMAGKDQPLAWQTIMSNVAPTPRDLRKFIIVKPVLDYNALEPGKKATDTIRALAEQLNLTPDHGVRLRMTGSVPLNDQEFASVANGTGFATILSIVLVFVILLLALRSFRLVLPILFTLATGLIATTAFALATIGSLNLISVAFAVMFIGIAVDFGIQFGVRYRDQHFHHPDHNHALMRTARMIAVPLAMAAGSTSLGFLCFIPTDYRGVSELGLIAGIGMLIAFLLSITLLPALLSLARPPAEREPVGYPWAAPADRFIARHRGKIIMGALILAIAGCGLITQLRFDFDPLDLKDPHTESVSTLFDLMKNPDFNPYIVEILRPSLPDAEALAAELQKVPEVDHVMTLASFVPDDQDAKLALISDTVMLLQPTLSPPSIAPPPSDQQILESMSKVAAALYQIGGQHPSAGKLASALDQVIARHDHDLLLRLQKDIIDSLVMRLNSVRESLEAGRITIDTITPDLRNDWVTQDGRALVEVYPKGNPRNHASLVAFTSAVRHVAPDASGTPISIQESGKTVTSAFIHAGIYALIAISLLSLLILRRLRDVAMLIAPLILAGILTLATIVIIGLPLNFANIIALPLLLSLGVSYAIYFISYCRAGLREPLQSSMARAVLFSAATTLVAFGSLSLSSHPGTASMGKLLTVALLYSLASTFFILPALCAAWGKTEDNKKTADSK